MQTNSYSTRPLTHGDKPDSRLGQAVVHWPRWHLSTVALSVALVCATATTAAAQGGSSKVDVLPYFDSPEFTPRWLNPHLVPADFHQVPAFSLRDQRGDVVNNSAVKGKITIVDFFFTRCRGICPRLLKGMKAVDAALPSDAPVVLLSHTVTPDIDTPAVLNEYAARNAVTSNRWHFLTGRRQAIYALGRSAYFVEEDLGVKKSDDDFLHSENVVLVDETGRIRGIYNGLNQASLRQLVADATTLVAALRARTP